MRMSSHSVAVVSKESVPRTLVCMATSSASAESGKPRVPKMQITAMKTASVARVLR